MSSDAQTPRIAPDRRTAPRLLAAGIVVLLAMGPVGAALADAQTTTTSTEATTTATEAALTTESTTTTTTTAPTPEPDTTAATTTTTVAAPGDDAPPETDDATTTTTEATTTTTEAELESLGLLAAESMFSTSAIEGQTHWTVGLEVTDSFGYSGPWRLAISESVIASTAYDLKSGERSDGLTPVSGPSPERPAGGSYLVFLIGGSSFTKSWSCVGDDSTTPQVSTADAFWVTTTVDDTTMDCTLTLSNPTPSTLVIEHVYPDDPLATATYDVVYGTTAAPTTESPGAGGTLAHGQSTSLTTWNGQSLFITGASVAGAWLTGVQCSNSADGGFPASNVNATSGSATVNGFRMRTGLTTTCQFVYEALGTVTIVEDSEPDAPAADYVASPADRVISGPTVFSLSDGQTQTLSLAPNQNVSLTRDALPEYDLESLQCVRLLEGGTTEPVSVSFWLSWTGDVFLTIPGTPGVDLECTFTSVLSGPPTIWLSQRLLVIDPSAFDDLVVEIRDASTDAVVDTIDFGTISDPWGVEVTLPDRGGTVHSNW